MLWSADTLPGWMLPTVMILSGNHCSVTWKEESGPDRRAIGILDSLPVWSYAESLSHLLLLPLSGHRACYQQH